MKKLSSLFLCLVVICLNAQVATDWQIENLNGRVKSIKNNVFKAIAKDGKIEKGTLYDLNEQTFFNTKGFINLINSYTNDGEIEMQTKTTFNKKGQKIETNAYLPAEKEEISKEIYIYDKNGKLTEIKRYDGGEFSGSDTGFKFDAKGNLLEKISKDATNNESKIVNEYENNLLKTQNIFSDGHLTLKVTFVYDAHNNPTEVSSLMLVTKQHFVQSFQYTYDNQNNWIKRVEFEDNEPINIHERVIEYYSK